MITLAASSADTSPSRAATAPSDFPELETFSTQQLEELLTQEAAFSKLLGNYIDKSQPLQVRPLSR